MPGETIRLVDQQGTIRDVPLDGAGAAIEAGWRVPTHEQEAGRVVEQAREESYGGTGGAIRAGIAGAARGVTLGLSDVAAGALGGEDTAIALEGLREQNPGISTVSEIGGAIAPALLTAGASTPAGLTAAAGRSVARAAGGGLRGAIAGGAAEGALYGVGQGVSELALSQDPLTVEQAASALGSNILFGGVTGGVAGAAAHGIATGLTRAKGAIDSAIERRAVKATTPAEAIENGDLALLDKPKLDVAEKAEIARIKEEQAPQRKTLVDELSNYNSSNRNDDAFRAVTAAAEDRDVAAAGASFTRADIRLRNLLDDRVGLAKMLAEDPEAITPLLRKQRQALTEEIIPWAREQEVAWKRAVEEAPAKIRQEIKSGLVKNELGPFTEHGLDLAVERVLKERQSLRFDGAFVDGLKMPSSVQLMPEAERVLAWNQKFQAQLDELAKPPTSDRLAKIAEARAVLEAPKEPSLGGAVMSAVMPFAGPVGVAAAAGNRVLGSFRKVVDAATTRLGKAASAFLDVGAKAASSDIAVPLATKTLSAIAFAPRRKDEEQPTTLPALYKRATDEVKSQTAYDETGAPRIRPEARQALAKRLQPLAVTDPVLADRLETAGVKRIEYLSSILPRMPDVFALAPGPTRWHPSDMEMRGWARAAHALEDPHGVLERAVHGAITPEEVAAIRAVHPEILQDYLGRVMADLHEKPRALPYHRLMALSMLSGHALDPALDPRIMSVLQGQFVDEVGSAGGTQAPKAQPQFGSIRKSADQPTPAQARAQGAHV